MVSVEGLRVKQLRTYAKKCKACFRLEVKGGNGGREFYIFVVRTCSPADQFSDCCFNCMEVFIMLIILRQFWDVKQADITLQLSTKCKLSNAMSRRSFIGTIFSQLSVSTFS